MRKMIVIVPATAVVLGGLHAEAGTIYLKNGQEIPGRVLEITPSEVVISVEAGTVTIERRAVDAIALESSDPAARALGVRGEAVVESSPVPGESLEAGRLAANRAAADTARTIAQARRDKAVEAEAEIYAPYQIRRGDVAMRLADRAFERQQYLTAQKKYEDARDAYQRALTAALERRAELARRGARAEEIARLAAIRRARLERERREREEQERLRREQLAEQQRQQRERERQAAAVIPGRPEQAVGAKSERTRSGATPARREELTEQEAQQVQQRLAAEREALSQAALAHARAVATAQTAARLHEIAREAEQAAQALEEMRTPFASSASTLKKLIALRQTLERGRGEVATPALDDPVLHSALAQLDASLAALSSLEPAWSAIATDLGNLDETVAALRQLAESANSAASEPEQLARGVDVAALERELERLRGWQPETRPPAEDELSLLAGFAREGERALEAARARRDAVLAAERAREGEARARLLRDLDALEDQLAAAERELGRLDRRAQQRSGVWLRAAAAHDQLEVAIAAWEARVGPGASDRALHEEATSLLDTLAKLLADYERRLEAPPSGPEPEAGPLHERLQALREDERSPEEVRGSEAWREAFESVGAYVLLVAQRETELEAGTKAVRVIERAEQVIVRLTDAERTAAQQAEQEALARARTLAARAVAQQRARLLAEAESARAAAEREAGQLEAEAQATAQPTNVELPAQQEAIARAREAAARAHAEAMRREAQRAAEQAAQAAAAEAARREAEQKALEAARRASEEAARSAQQEAARQAAALEAQRAAQEAAEAAAREAEGAAREAAEAAARERARQEAEQQALAAAARAAAQARATAEAERAARQAAELAARREREAAERAQREAEPPQEETAAASAPAGSESGPAAPGAEHAQAGEPEATDGHSATGTPAAVAETGEEAVAGAETETAQAAQLRPEQIDALRERLDRALAAAEAAAGDPQIATAAQQRDELRRAVAELQFALQMRAQVRGFSTRLASLERKARKVLAQLQPLGERYARFAEALERLDALRSEAAAQLAARPAPDPQRAERLVTEIDEAVDALVQALPSGDTAAQLAASLENARSAASDLVAEAKRKGAQGEPETAREQLATQIAAEQQRRSELAQQVERARKAFAAEQAARAEAQRRAAEQEALRRAAAEAAQRRAQREALEAARLAAEQAAAEAALAEARRQAQLEAERKAAERRAQIVQARARVAELREALSPVLERARALVASATTVKRRTDELGAAHAKLGEALRARESLQAFSTRLASLTRKARALTQKIEQALATLEPIATANADAAPRAVELENEIAGLATADDDALLLAQRAGRLDDLAQRLEAVRDALASVQPPDEAWLDELPALAVEAERTAQALAAEVQKRTKIAVDLQAAAERAAAERARREEQAAREREERERKAREARARAEAEALAEAQRAAAEEAAKAEAQRRAEQEAQRLAAEAAERARRAAEEAAAAQASGAGATAAETAGATAGETQPGEASAEEAAEQATRAAAEEAARAAAEEAARAAAEREAAEAAAQRERERLEAERAARLESARAALETATRARNEALAQLQDGALPLLERTSEALATAQQQLAEARSRREAFSGSDASLAPLDEQGRALLEQLEAARHRAAQLGERIASVRARAEALGKTLDPLASDEEALATADGSEQFEKAVSEADAVLAEARAVATAVESWRTETDRLAQQALAHAQAWRAATEAAITAAAEAKARAEAEAKAAREAQERAATLSAGRKLAAAIETKIEAARKTAAALRSQIGAQRALLTGARKRITEAAASGREHPAVVSLANEAGEKLEAMLGRLEQASRAIDEAGDLASFEKELETVRADEQTLVDAVSSGALERLADRVDAQTDKLLALQGSVQATVKEAQALLRETSKVAARMRETIEAQQRAAREEAQRRAEAEAAEAKARAEAEARAAQEAAERERAEKEAQAARAAAEGEQGAAAAVQPGTTESEHAQAEAEQPATSLAERARTLAQRMQLGEPVAVAPGLRVAAPSAWTRRDRGVEGFVSFRAPASEGGYASRANVVTIDLPPAQLDAVANELLTELEHRGYGSIERHAIGEAQARAIEIHARLERDGGQAIVQYQLLVPREGRIAVLTVAGEEQRGAEVLAAFERMKATLR